MLCCSFQVEPQLYTSSMLQTLRIYKILVKLSSILIFTNILKLFVQFPFSIYSRNNIYLKSSSNCIKLYSFSKKIKNKKELKIILLRITSFCICIYKNIRARLIYSKSVNVNFFFNIMIQSPNFYLSLIILSPPLNNPSPIQNIHFHDNN